MISQASQFKLMDRGFKRNIVLIPGWATDRRIFGSLELDYNYILPEKLNPFGFNAGLSLVLNKNSINRVSLFGWSLGGFLAVDFALKNPDRIDEVILLGIRKRFDSKTLENVRRKLKESKKAYLYKFYLECFSGAEKKELSWFRRHLLRDYLGKMSMEDLISGLDYFSKAYIDIKTLASIKKLRVFHGSADRIAPVKEIEEIKSSLTNQKFIIMPDAGHMPFLNHNFLERFKDG
ncbi:MAG: alpha/beta hydrolase [Candidatus Omnitrophica bacterium]|nr:alpha/beta hydrolase [Candidatus Omnitrophota bacterium]MDD5238127.1 alpha/beta hydrolase [Candidatus Omnitrophota bacterium]